jgi:chromosome segregation ATPase
MASNFSFRFKQFTQRLRETTQLPQFFTDQATSETQNLARELALVGEYATQLSQVVMEVDFLNQLYTRLLNEREVLQQEKDHLEARVFELQQERNETEPQVMYLREQLSQASFQLEQTQNRERSLSERERQLSEIVAQLERRRAVLNQAIENLTNQEADYTVSHQRTGGGRPGKRKESQAVPGSCQPLPRLPGRAQCSSARNASQAEKPWCRAQARRPAPT